jgi:transcriptional regulator with XRE-family HTH domain
MNDLGTALRAWRDRLDPATVGLPRNGSRRAPGLRREELALLAGVSIDYVVRLEQGRATTPSAQVCSALARALQLDDEEQAHLLRLAGHAPNPHRIPRLIPGSVHRILEQLGGHPLAVYDATWTLLHWNPLFAAVFGDPSALSAEQRNTLLGLFGGVPVPHTTRVRVRHTPAEMTAFAESMVADLRVTAGRYPDDPDLAALLARLHGSPWFTELWERRTVAEHQGSHKVVEHPEVGEIEVSCDTLATRGSDLRVVVFTPHPGTDARGKLDLLAAVGTQEIVSR